MSRSSDTKTANIYILTETGSHYTEEGKQYLMDNMSEKHNIADFVFHEGKSYNDPETLIKSLKNTVNPYVVISMDLITVLYYGNIDAAIRALNDHKDRSAWETLTKVIRDLNL